MRVSGRSERRELPGGVHLEGGEVELALTFVGGAAPQVAELGVVGALRWGERTGTALDADARRALLDGVDVGGPLRLDVFAEAVVAGLSDVNARVEAVPDGEVLVKFQHGVHAVLSPRALVVVEGAAAGPPGSLRLAGPLVMTVNGEGLRLSHERFRRLSSLASVRIEGASLHPDGEVRLWGGANAMLDRVVQGGLERASARLSDLIRRSPRFARVRTFLSR